MCTYNEFVGVTYDLELKNRILLSKKQFHQSFWNIYDYENMHRKLLDIKSGVL